MFNRFLNNGRLIIVFNVSERLDYVLFMLWGYGMYFV